MDVLLICPVNIDKSLYRSNKSKDKAKIVPLIKYLFLKDYKGCPYN